MSEPDAAAAPLIALTIAGLDPSSGAGITADLQTFAAHGVFGISCVSAVTVQSTRGVRRVEPVGADLVRDMLDCLEDDLPPGGIKIGMLGTADLVHVVADYLRSVRARRPVYVVLDPVLRSSSGAVLLDDGGVTAMCDSLLPLCDCATPNREELAAMARGAGADDLVKKARWLQQRIGGRELIVTGGEEREPNDLVVRPDGEAAWLRGTRIETTSTHGTGCAFSSAFLSRRMAGDDVVAACRQAKVYVEEALRTARKIGGGRGPMNLLWPRPVREEWGRKKSSGQG